MKPKIHLKPLLTIVFLVFCPLLLSTPLSAELSVESYCQAAAQVGQQELVYLGKLDVLTGKYTESYSDFQRYCSNPKVYLDQRAAFQKEFNDAKAAIFTVFGTTPAEYSAFGIVNKDAIAAYLAANPDVKATLEGLSGEINKFKAKVKVPTYCLLTIAHAMQKFAQINEQIEVARQYSDTRESFLEQEQLKRKEWDAKINTLFKLFDTSIEEYLTFMGKNAQATKQYLDRHEVIKKKIDELSGQVLTVLRQYEELRKNIVTKATPGPPRR